MDVAGVWENRFDESCGLPGKPVGKWSFEMAVVGDWGNRIDGCCW